MEEETRFAKGKRTKRSRPVGPISSSGGSHSDGAAASSSTTTTSTKFSDEDMAHCLILLAQSRSRSPESMKPLVLHDTGREVFVYQCKTCDRCFPSFQALGGHRASHKKLKPPLAEDKSECTDYGSSLKLSLQLGIRTQPALATKVPPRVHECSLCGAEFGSGQALGGHMRRHRTLTATPLATVIPDIKDSDGRRISFDLNIPPAPEAEFEGNSFVFSSTKNRTPVFPTSDLVHCHY